MIVFRLGPKRSRSTATDQLLAVAGSCLPMSFVRDNNIKRWVNYIAPKYKLPHVKKLGSESRKVSDILRPNDPSFLPIYFK